jgi:hypothetical protein
MMMRFFQSQLEHLYATLQRVPQADTFKEAGNEITC